MTFNQEGSSQITEKGRQLLTLIQDAGSAGISRKGLTDALKEQLHQDDHEQLGLLESEGLITVHRVDLVDHPDEDYVYRAGGLAG